MVAPAARIEKIQIILAISAQFGWLVHHLDVKIAFPNGETSDEVYVSQHEEYKDPKRKNDVYKLQRHSMV